MDERSRSSLSVSTAADTESAGQQIDEGKGRIFPCESCGADLRFHIGEQRLKCPYCGFTKLKAQLHH